MAVLTEQSKVFGSCQEDKVWKERLQSLEILARRRQDPKTLSYGGAKLRMAVSRQGQPLEPGNQTGRLFH